MNLQFPETFDFVKKDLDNLGVWELRTTKYIQDHVKVGQTFTDIGAQVGYFSVLASQLGAVVTAFEPSTINQTFLKKNLANNNATATIIGKALSNTNGLIKLFSGKTPGENSILENYHNGTGYEEVDAIRYDDLNREVTDWYKIDIEGAERLALEGMQSVLTTTKPITLIIEDWENKVTDWLIDTHGFSLVTTDRGSGNRILSKNQHFTYEEEPLTCHLLGTFNSPVTLADEGIGNAFGTKVINMAKLLKKLGHKVIFYGVEGSQVECDEFVQVSTKENLVSTYGTWDGKTIYPEKYGDVCHTTFNENCIREIQKRYHTGDFLLVSHGTFHKPIVDAVNTANQLFVVEIGIGHNSSFAQFRIFESEFQRAWTYGREDNDLNTNPMPGNRTKHLGNFYDRVIPGFFDSSDFIYQEKKDDYYLYLGRIMMNKGIYVAQQVCQKLNKRLVVAGFYYDCDKKWFDEFIAMPNVEYVGFAGFEKRKQLMAHAKALLLPTLYLEPFGYVVIEANMSGTPVITTDFGAFPETVQQGVTGFRCHTFAEFLQAMKDVEQLKPSACREWAMRYTIDTVAPLYQQYFTQITNLIGKGWYTLPY